MSSTTEGESRLPASERLRRAENYHSWKSRVYNILEGKGLEDFIEPTCTKPEPVEAQTTLSQDLASSAARLAEIKAWEVNNGRAKTTIQANCTQEPNDLIVDIATASEMWTTLETQYEGQGQSLK